MAYLLHALAQECMNLALLLVQHSIFSFPLNLRRLVRLSAEPWNNWKVITWEIVLR